VTELGKAEVNIREAHGMQEASATAASISADVVGILDTIDVPIVVVGRDCAVTRFNRAAAEALGVSTSDIGRQTCNIEALMGLPEIDAMCRQVMADGVPSRREMHYGDRWFLVRIAPYTGTDQQARGAVLTFTNFTAFRASLGQAIYEREYTKTILNAVIDPLVVLDDRLQVQTANRPFYDWFGASREQTQNVPLSNLGDDDWRATGLWSSLRATLSHNSEFHTIELERDFPNIGRRTVLLDARRLVRDGNALVLLSFRDITKRKHAEHALRESETRFRTLFESMDEGYCVVEVIFDEKNNPTDYRFLEINPVFEKQTGIKNARGRLMREIAPAHEQHWFDMYGRIALSGETLRFERPAAALQRYYEVCAFRVGAPELRRVGVVFNDITGRKSLERQRELLLAQEEALRKDAEAAVRAKDHFLAALSHELRTPLSPVVLTVAAMESDPDLPERFRKHVAMIRRNVGLETRLIDDLLDLNRVTSGKMHLHVQPTHMHAVLAQAIQTCDSETSAKKLNVQLDLQADNDLVNADPARLQQIFWNLLRNATKFTPEGGSIFVRTENSADRVRLEVRDTGVGIEPEFLPKVFDAFEQGDVKITRQFGGLGLGLAICKAIMDIHGGAIRAQSDGPGTGATFTVELPVASATEQEVAATRPPQGPDNATERLRVLLVEDHPDTCEVLSRLLNAANYAVKAASSVETALQLAAAEGFDVVISDLGLPDGTGYDLMRQLRDRHGIKGIALSGYGMEQDQRRSREVGFLDHVVKPVDVSQLVAVIQRIVNSHTSGSRATVETMVWRPPP
jgi:PAS domain S-box-containing protein